MGKNIFGMRSYPELKATLTRSYLEFVCVCVCACVCVCVCVFVCVCACEDINQLEAHSTSELL